METTIIITLGSIAGFMLLIVYLLNSEKPGSSSDAPGEPAGEMPQESNEPNDLLVSRD